MRLEPPTKQELDALYAQQGTVAGVARALGVSPATARDWLAQAGVQRAPVVPKSEWRAGLGRRG